MLNQSINHVHSDCVTMTVIRHINRAAFSLRHCRQMHMVYDLKGAYKRWLQFENVSCTHLHAVLRKIEISATRCPIFKHQIWFTLWLLRQTPLGAYSTPPDLLAVFEGLTFKKRRDKKGLEGSGGYALYIVPRLEPTTTLSGPAHKTAKIILFTMSATWPSHVVRRVL